MTTLIARNMSGVKRITLLGILVAAVALALLATAWPPGRDALAAAQERSAQEWIRYLLRRLEGHPKLEAVLVPPLHAAQRHIEREPPAGPLPSLGKGQQAQSLLPSVSGLTQTLRVDTPQAIREALLNAQPGTQIVVAPGLYPFSTKLRLGHDGQPGAPIALRAAQPGTVWFTFEQVEGVLVDRPHWVFENLDIRGTCTRHEDCEHAFHVVGRATHALIRNNRLSDFNAHIKVNGWDGHWPDHGQLLHNTLTNNAPRETIKSVTPFDLVGASHWRVEDNWVTNFVKAWGNGVAFGLFMKGGGDGGKIERNLVVCTPSGISRPGVRVGISFGGGGTDPALCRTKDCEAYEHSQGLAANNIVAHCNDVGLDVNHSRDITLAHNTLINTAGVSMRRPPSQARLQNNLIEGHLGARGGSELTAQDNLTLAPSGLLANADALQLDWVQRPADAPHLSAVPLDFLRRPRDVVNAPGALR